MSKFIKRKEFIIHDDLQIEEVTTCTIEGMDEVAFHTDKYGFVGQRLKEGKYYYPTRAEAELDVDEMVKKLKPEIEKSIEVISQFESIDRYDSNLLGMDFDELVRNRFCNEDDEFYRKQYDTHRRQIKMLTSYIRNGMLYVDGASIKASEVEFVVWIEEKDNQLQASIHMKSGRIVKCSEPGNVAALGIIFGNQHGYIYRQDVDEDDVMEDKGIEGDDEDDYCGDDE